MLSIARIGRGQQDYYLDKVARGAEEYYTHSGEAPGRWWGGGAEALALCGVVGEDELAAVLDGMHPKDATALVAGARSPRRRVGFDLTFSAPKGVSLLGQLGGGDLRRTVASGHDDAVAQALTYLEAHAAFARRGHGGALRMQTCGLVAAAFVHRSSRAPDPQIHTHVLVANVVQGIDGRWSALDARALYAHARTAGFIYQAVLRANLTRQLGLAWAPVHAGMAEPASFAASQLRAFSTRRAQVEAAMAEHGAHSAKAAQVAAHRTRAPKDPGLSAESLAATWSARAAEVGIDAAMLAAMCGPGRQAGLGTGRDEVFAHLLGPSGLTAQDSVFDERAVIRALADAATEGISLDELNEATAALLSRPEVVVLASMEPATGGPRYSTAEMLEVEAALLAGAQRRRAQGAASVSDKTLAAVLARRPDLSSEQADIVRALTTSGDGVEVVLGVAGTGKTFALEAARAAWQAGGYEVIGTALAARAAAELGSATGMPAGTLARLLAELERAGPEGRLGPHAVVVLDEAGMVGTRAMARLAAIAERDGAKLVLVGDPRQLPEIEAGGAMAALAASLGAIELTQNRRQNEAWERAALSELRSGRVTVALAAYQDQGRIVLADTAPGARAAMVADWWQARQAGASVAMLALRHAEVEALNHAARALMADSGALGAQCEIAGRAFAVGDEVIGLRNDARVGITNGTRAHIAALGPDGSMSLVGADGRAIEVPGSYVQAGHLSHGYAMTIHKAQGATVERAFVLGSDAMYREAGYVAMSRARARADIYVVAPEPDPEAHGAGPESPGPQGVLTAALGVSRAKSLASEQLAAEVDGAGLVDLDGESARIGAALLSTLVPDPTPRIAALAELRSRVQGALAQGALAPAPDDVPRPGPSSPGATPPEHLVRWATDELGRIDAQADILDEARTARLAWEAEHAGELAALAAARDGADRARSALGRGLLAAPGEHLLELLGPVPLRAGPRAAWQAAAVEVETYRARFGLAGPDIGERPAQVLQAGAWEATMRAVEVARGRGGLDAARSGPDTDIGRWH